MKTCAATSTTIGTLEVVLWLHTTAAPNAADWAQGIALVLDLKKKANGDLSRFRSVVVTDGGAPNATQRKELHEVFDRKPHQLAVITNSLTNPIKRGVATAIAWLNPAFKAVSVDDWREALHHADLTGELGPLLVVFRKLQDELPKVSSLAELERLAELSATEHRAPLDG